MGRKGSPAEGRREFLAGMRRSPDLGTVDLLLYLRMAVGLSTYGDSAYLYSVYVSKPSPT